MAINSLFDYILIEVTSLIIKNTNKRRYYIIACLCGGVSSVIHLLLNTYTGTSIRIILYIFTLLLMSKIAFNDDIVNTVVNSIVLIFTALLLCGTFNLFIDNKSNILNHMGIFVYTSKYRFLTLTILAIGLWFAIKIVNNKLSYHKAMRENLWNVFVEFEDEHVYTSGLFDSGNSLRDPITKKPVCILEAGLIRDEKALYSKGIYAIPYNSVGKSNGIIYGVKAKKMEISKKNGTVKKTYNNVIIAIYKGNLSSEGKYRMLINSYYF